MQYYHPFLQRERQISAVISKVLAKPIADSIRPKGSTTYLIVRLYLDKNKLLNTYLSGFQSLHSTMTALLETTNNWSVKIDDGLFIKRRALYRP